MKPLDDVPFDVPADNEYGAIGSTLEASGTPIWQQRFTDRRPT
jgi:hypothetical protein